jgi:hypothetical protein
LPIFQAGCAVGGQLCHSNDPNGNASPGSLVLGSELGTTVDPAIVVAQIVGKPSMLDPSELLVKPGDPNASFLMVKMDGDQSRLVGECNRVPMYRAAYPNCGCSMPMLLDAGALAPGECRTALLDLSTRDLVRAWIAQGAQNN